MSLIVVVKMWNLSSFFVKNSHAQPLLFFEVVGHSCILGTLFDSQQMAEFRVSTNPVKFSFNDVLNILFNLIVIELDSRLHLRFVLGIVLEIGN